MFEYKLKSFRGQLGEDVEAELNKLGAEGWEIASAYPVADAASAMVTHQFVMRRGVTGLSTAPTKRR